MIQNAVPTFRARSMPNAPAFDPQRVFSLQLMLSKFEYDRKLNPCFTSGSFELAVSELAVQRTRRGVPLLVMGSRDDTECGTNVSSPLNAECSGV